MSQTETSFDPPAPGGNPRPPTPAGYRPPVAFVIGDAVELMRRDNVSGLRDGTGGWGTWGN